MAKNIASKIINKKIDTNKGKPKKTELKENGNDYLFQMSFAPRIGDSTHWVQMIPAAFFTAFIIMIVYMKVYERPMIQFFWSNGKTQLSDFFSYYKMAAILICAVLALIILLYRVFTQSFYIKKSYVYIPVIVYISCVLLSYVLSDYKIFALWGWNERFEGTLTLLGYMVLFLYIINSVNTEKNVKWIIYPTAISSALLGILGISQALDHDFFRTVIGKKMITPGWFWDQVDSLNFTFQNKQIYQTVYNINYVSFYLTLLIPLFGMLFINSMDKKNPEPIWKKIIWGLLFTLSVFNLIGSASSGGLLGMAFVVIVGLIVLNKRIFDWKKPVVFLLLITFLVSIGTYERWMPELTNAVKGVLGINAPVSQSASSNENNTQSDTNIQNKIDYIETTGQAIIISYEGNEIVFTTHPDNPTALTVKTISGESLPLIPTNISPIYQVDDERFKRMTVRYATDDTGGDYIVIGMDGNEWPFKLSEDGPKYLTGLGKTIDLRKVPSFGWEHNQGFGSGRGYIWSRTIPLMKDTMILGHGADTYCIYFPHDDFVGKYNSPNYHEKINIVVDKPHNMYMGMIIGTGGLSALALLVLFGFYIVQSFKIYMREKYESFISYVGAGIFFGVCGFLVSGMVNDSTVSVMPLFYGLLGTGIAVNQILKNRISSETSV